MVSRNSILGKAIADELFGPDRAGRPVYALADEQSLARIAATAGLAGEPEEAIVEVVRRTLALDDPGVGPFRWQSESADLHAAHPIETPPALPLLLILTLAAERMQADGELAAHNYYSRLHRLLRVPTDRYGRFEEDYRRHAVQLWGSLNAWLEAWEGERGVPTAYAVGSHEFVGLPMSQAVVRQHDRAGLHEVFSLEGLAPGVRLSPDDMYAAMDPYATVSPSPLSAHVRRLWPDSSVRERIVDAACLELEAWDGARVATDIVQAHSVAARLLAFVRLFPRRSVHFNLLLPVRTSESVLARFVTPEGVTDIATAVGPGGSTRLSTSEAVQGTSLVEEEVSGGLVGDVGQAFSRRPRRVVPMRWDGLQGGFLEVERVALGEDGVVLVKHDARLRVEQYFATHARGGWREATELAGVPEGWLLYEQVQMLSAPTGLIHLDLIALAPRARTSLTLRGGFSLPGLLRKWSSLDPPEVVALASGATTVCVRVYASTRIDPTAIRIESQRDGELCIVTLQDAALEDGEYTVAMFVDGAARPSSTALLRLRSADTPQFNVEDADIRLVYAPDASPTWPLSAVDAERAEYVNGARLRGFAAQAHSAQFAMPEFQPRERLSSGSAKSIVRVGRPVTGGACLTTGMHRIQLPTVRPDQPNQRTVEGECIHCGLVKRQPTTAWGARRRDAPAALQKREVFIPPSIETGNPNYEVAFDAVNHVGHGSFSTFERIAAQVEGSGLFADSFLRRQEVAGHIDVRRDDWLQVSEWAVNAASLVPVGSGRWALIGARSRGLVDRLSKVLSGTAELRETVEAGLARVEVIGSLPSARLLAEIGVVVLDASPSARIAAGLPPLSDVASGLKRIAIPSYRVSEVWDTASASWRRCASLAHRGAYRLRDFRSLYVVRSDVDLSAGTIAIGNAQVVKHIANLWVGDPLIGYHSPTGSVVVPLGADVPALYGRALSLSSGRAPIELETSRLLQYPSVPREVADAVFDRLTR